MVQESSTLGRKTETEGGKALLAQEEDRIDVLFSHLFPHLITYEEAEKGSLSPTPNSTHFQSVLR